MSRSTRTLLYFALPSFLACQSYAPITPPRLGSPAITKIYLTEAKFDSLRPAIRVQWTAPVDDSIGIRSYTLLRSVDTGRTFDLFSNSNRIPASITQFNDNLAVPSAPAFPSNGYVRVAYRILAIDTLGRPGDTSPACSLFLSPRPIFKKFDSTAFCFEWQSHNIQGAVTTSIKIWDSTRAVTWTSLPLEAFGNENSPVPFRACIADSLRPLAGGLWHFVVYLYANGADHQSITIGTFDVP